MEIEVSPRLVSSGLVLLLILAPLLVGVHGSPVTEDGRPLLLTPRLAHLNGYRRDVRDWVKALQETDDGIAALLEEPADDLFEQNERINRYALQMRRVADTIDQTPPPPTFEPLHALLEQTAAAYLDAVALVARWISEPSDENQQLAMDALTTAGELLERLHNNPWIEVTP